ncbi:hypothetical protein ACFW6V_32825 [Streptomyces sp. NPDC058734]|uniref:hypothetical protein n=1 Tax=Streptomyces sp. NPDC058734 TaxID=3346615 RepID=UPI00368B3412
MQEEFRCPVVRDGGKGLRPERRLSRWRQVISGEAGVLELTTPTPEGLGWLRPPADGADGAVWLFAERTTSGTELLVGSVVAADPDRAPDPVCFVPGPDTAPIAADELTLLGPPRARLSQLILPDAPGSDARILLPDRGEQYALNRLTEPDIKPGAFLRLLLPGAVVHEDTEWTVRHGGVVSSPQGCHVTAHAVRRPGAPDFPDPWPQQPLRLLFEHGPDMEDPEEISGGGSGTPPHFDEYRAVTATTDRRPNAVVVVLDDPTREGPPIRLRLPLPAT